MLNITFSAGDAHTAEQMQNDLSQSGVRPENPMLIVLITPDSVEDEVVLSGITKAQTAGQVIAPVILRKSALPDSLKGVDSLDLSKKYDKKKLIAFVKRRGITKERRVNNRRLLFIVTGIVLLMFVISLISIARGIVAFPVDEYSTENAIRDAQVATLVAPQIELVLPRTTEDALNFPATLEAIRNDDLVPFIIETVTAMPQQRLATDEARMTQAFGTEVAQTQTAGE